MAGWSWDNFERDVREGGQGACGGFFQSAQELGGWRPRLMKHGVVLQHPARQHGLGGFLDPFVDQGRNFAPEVGGVIQPRELETFQ